MQELIAVKRVEIKLLAVCGWHSRISLKVFSTDSKKTNIFTPREKYASVQCWTRGNN